MYWKHMQGGVHTELFYAIIPTLFPYYLLMELMFKKPGKRICKHDIQSWIDKHIKR